MAIPAGRWPMCDYCSAGSPGDENLDADLLWRLARGFEAGLGGRSASERDWRIFMGRATGSLAFEVMQRLGLCRQHALDALRTPARSGFRCEQVC
jgi:hypothetical protein